MSSLDFFPLFFFPFLCPLLSSLLFYSPLNVELLDYYVQHSPPHFRPRQDPRSHVQVRCRLREDRDG